MWKAEKFLINTVAGPLFVDGATYNGIGLHIEGEGWSLTHLNSGLSVMRIDPVRRDDAQAAATAFADLTDWSFMEPTGWRNRDPELPAKIAAWRAKHRMPEQPAGSQLVHERYHDAAKAIAAVRE